MVVREITKIHESFVEGSASEVAEYFKTHPGEVRGEFVVIVAV
jgi:16S rRNA C1402 (ribose-2'-O) methylase RsmI